MMELINAERALELLDEVVAEYGPDHKAECRYATLEYDPDEDAFVPTEAVCIIGVCLVKAGIPITAFGNRDKFVTDVLPDLKEQGLIDYTREGLEVWGLAQDEQDRGVPWGQDVEVARALAQSEGWI